MKLLIILFLITSSVYAQEVCYDYTGLSRQECQEAGISEYSSQDSSTWVEFKDDTLRVMYYVQSGSIPYFKIAAWYYITDISVLDYRQMHVVYYKEGVKVTLRYDSVTDQTMISVFNE